jgi:hypothetical protein
VKLLPLDQFRQRIDQTCGQHRERLLCQFPGFVFLFNNFQAGLIGIGGL